MLVIATGEKRGHFRGRAVAEVGAGIQGGVGPTGAVDAASDGGEAEGGEVADGVGEGEGGSGKARERDGFGKGGREEAFGEGEEWGR